MSDNRDTQRRLLNYLRPHTKVLSAGLLCAAVTAMITVSIAKFLEIALDAMRYGDLTRLTWMCIAVVAIFFVKGVFSFGQSYLLSLTANRVATRIRDEIYSHLHHLSLAFFNQRRTGAIMSTLTSDVPVLQAAAMSLKDAIAAPINNKRNLRIKASRGCGECSPCMIERNGAFRAARVPTQWSCHDCV